MGYSNATFFIDPENGSDAARTALTGVSFANNGSGGVRGTKVAHGLQTGMVVTITTTVPGHYLGDWKITRIDADNFDLDTAAYIANNTGGTVTPFGGFNKADAWKTIITGATAARHKAGDTIRIIGSPAPTSLAQNGEWTSALLNPTQAITSSTNATPIVITKANHGYSTGDTVVINAHTTNTKANGVWEINVLSSSTYELVGSVGNGVGGATGTMRKINNCRVKLTTAVTQAIAVVGNQGVKGNWTASANVTATVITTDFKEGGECQKLDIAAGFTTGLAAYYATGLLDLSAYKQVTFWIKQTAGTVGASGACSLTLCSDVAGATPVNTISIPTTAIVGYWMPVTVDTGAALGAAIQSIGFVVNTDNGAQTFQIDCITACKDSANADSLTLTSLIGKNSGVAGEGWWGIQSINGTRVMLDGDTNCIPASATIQRGYYGTSETVTTWKRETIKTGPASAYASNTATTNSAGTAGNPITFSGGWDRTNMTVQNLETWFDGQNGCGYIGPFSQSYLAVEKLNYCRYALGPYVSGGVGLVWSTDMYCTNNSQYGLYLLGSNGSYQGAYAQAVSNHGNSPAVQMYVGGTGNAYGVISAISCGGSVSIIGTSCTVDSVVGANNTSYGVQVTGIGNTIGSLDSIHNGTSGGITVSGSLNVITGATSAVVPTGYATASAIHGILVSGNYNQFGDVDVSGFLQQFGVYVTGGNNIFGDVTSSGNQYGFIVYGDDNYFASATANNNTLYGYYTSGARNTVKGGSTTGNGSGSINLLAGALDNYFKNFTPNEATEVTVPTTYSNVRLSSENHDGVAGNNITFCEGGRIQTETTIRHTASGLSWALKPTSTNRQALYPLTLSMGLHAVAANGLVTASLWVRRSNTGLTLRFVCKGGQISGVAADVVATASAAVDTWEELTITFTPTADGVVELQAEAYGGTTYTGYVDDLSVSQA